MDMNLSATFTEKIKHKLAKSKCEQKKKKQKQKQQQQQNKKKMKQFCQRRKWNLETALTDFGLLDKRKGKADVVRELGKISGSVSHWAERDVRFLRGDCSSF